MDYQSARSIDGTRAGRFIEVAMFLRLCIERMFNGFVVTLESFIPAQSKLGLSYVYPKLATDRCGQ
ncbi:MAG: hypothetical protein OEZ47_10380 [Gammaproteobacteria bacterium]|nr:hypothetical protein [Gammaproteobacteria bacterium]